MILAAWLLGVAFMLLSFWQESPQAETSTICAQIWFAAAFVGGTSPQKKGIVAALGGVGMRGSRLRPSVIKDRLE
jgi:hypothetical protein